MPVNPDNPKHIPGNHPGLEKITQRTAEWNLSGRDLLGKGGKGPTLVPLSISEAGRIPSALIVEVPHSQNFSPRTIILVPHTYQSVATLLRSEVTNRQDKSGTDPSIDGKAEGEPIAGIIPQKFMDAYIASKVKQGHNPRHARHMAWWVQKISRNLTELGSLTPNVDNMLYVLDILVLKTPTVDDVEKDPTLREQSMDAVLTYEHSRLALRDPVGYVMYIIRTDAASQGRAIKIGDEQISKRLATFQRENYRKTHLRQRRPLAEQEGKGTSKVNTEPGVAQGSNAEPEKSARSQERDKPETIIRKIIIGDLRTRPDFNLAFAQINKTDWEKMAANLDTIITGLLLTPAITDAQRPKAIIGAAMIFLKQIRELDEKIFGVRFSNYAEIHSLVDSGKMTEEIASNTEPLSEIEFELLQRTIAIIETEGQKLRSSIRP